MRAGSFFPREIISDVPQVTMTGCELVHVEQHKGLVAYQPEQIIFRTSLGRLTVTGSGLRFQRYSATEAVLTGNVDSIVVGGSA